MQKKLTITLMFVVALIILLCGCTGSRSQSSSHWNFGSPDSFTQELSFEMKEPLVKLTLELDFSIDEGELSWIVIDPDGAGHHSGSISGRESFKEKWRFEPVYGTWILFVDGEMVKGSVSMIWEGSK